MAQTKRRVAVIGTGPAGAITTDALVKEQAFETIRVFERQDKIGGTWVFHGDRPAPQSVTLPIGGRSAPKAKNIPSSFPCQLPKPQDDVWETAAHENLHSNLPPEIMCFTQEPIPHVVSEHILNHYGADAPFRHRELIREWIETIFHTRGNEKLVEFNTSVELAEKVGDQWILTLRKSVKGEHKESWWQETFDALVVATGHYNLPWVPDIPGLADYDAKYPGRIRHTKHYRDPSDYKDKVLDWLIHFCFNSLGSNTDWIFAQRVVVVGGSVSAFDALHDIRTTSKHPVISSMRKPSAIFGAPPFKHPHIQNHSEIASFDSETGRINFTDGGFVDDVDVVLFATGYEFDFPFLPDINIVNRRIPGLYQHVFLARDPSLAFVGMVTGGFGLRIFEWQGVTVARVFAGRAKLPSREEMETWENERVLTVGDGIPFWVLNPDFETPFESYRALAGEPAPGTTGRVLPKYDPQWADAFWGLVSYRTKWWEKEENEAKAIKNS
ncbi:unnamed protein product [Clonostachys byssicola]|uniref:Thiol-specific monooxygenase n=1 Tax=Clonostachys byssicola TaxID=160290 RepID=A0A9N9YAJ1_9HYPO|nr:unnamed protein product [Clonostachys byssicola]